MNASVELGFSVSYSRVSRLRLLVAGMAAVVLASLCLVAAPGPARAADAATNLVTVVRVLAGGATAGSTTVTTLVDRVNGPVSEFWAEQTGGVVRFEATGWADWVTTTAPCSDPTAMWNQAAAAVGFQPGPGKHLFLYVSSYGVGSWPCDRGGATTGSGRTAGGMAYTRGTSVKEIAHELGHNLGLGHSSYRQCDEDGTNCRTVEQGDLYDVMSDPLRLPLGSLSAPQAARLGVLPAAEQVTFRPDGPGEWVTLAPMSAATGVRAVRMVSWAGVEYWLEYRTASGRDAWLGDFFQNSADLDTGVLVRESSSGSSTSWLHDATPSESEAKEFDKQAAVPAGWATPVGQSGFTVTVEEETGSAVTLRVTTPRSEPFPRDWTGDGYADLIAVDAGGTLYVYPGTMMGTFQPRRVLGRGWQARDMITMTGDWSGDGRPDLIARNPGTGELWLYRGNGTGGFLGWEIIGRGWLAMDSLFSPGDWDGDGHADLMARVKADGRLLLYSGDGRGGFFGAEHIGSGWGVFTALAATDDFNLDGAPDLAARHRDGTLYQYNGDGAGGFTGRVVIGRGWQIFNGVTGPGDFGSDGYPDVITRRTDGSLWHYVNDGYGRFRAWWKIGSGWNGFRLAA